MLYPYPSLCKGVALYECRRGKQFWYEVKNKDEESFLIDATMAELIMGIQDGYNPYQIPELSHLSEQELDCWLRYLLKRNVLKQSRVRHYRGPFFLVGLFPFRLRPHARFVRWTTLFLLLSFPITLLGSFSLLSRRVETIGVSYFSETTVHMLLALVIVLSCLFHELGHGISIAATGAGSTLEIGVLSFILPIGFYISLQDNPNISRFAKFAMSISGVSVNSLISSLCLLLCGYCGVIDAVLFVSGVANLWLTIFNLLPCPILDGCSALEALIGVDDITQWVLSSAKGGRGGHLGYAIFVYVIFFVVTILTGICLFLCML